jgi:hypothetical protein
MTMLIFAGPWPAVPSNGQELSGHAEAGAATWQLDYAFSGGPQGRSDRLLLTSDGRLIVEDFARGYRARGQATPAQMEEVDRLMTTLKPNAGQLRPSRPEPILDAFAATLTATFDGKEYPIDLVHASPSSLSGRLGAVLDRMVIAALKTATEVPFELGRVWKVREGMTDNAGRIPQPEWEAIWTRRGDTNTFDAVFRNRTTGEEVHDAIQLESAADRHVTLRRIGLGRQYRGLYNPLRQGIVKGTADSLPPGHEWQAQIEYESPAR